MDLAKGVYPWLDETDLRLILFLEANPRATYASVAQALGLTRDTAKYRLTRLIKRGIISFKLTLALDKLGFSSGAIIRVAFTSLENGTGAVIEEYANSNPLVTSCYKTLGEFDYMLIVNTKDNFQLDGVIRELKAKLGGFIKALEVVPIVG